MVLRTPRRRISPQTKLKCRAIKNFFNRAIGNQSYTETKTTKSSTSNETISTESSCEEGKFEEPSNSCNSLTRCTEIETKREIDKTEEEPLDKILGNEARYVNSKQRITPNTKVLYKKPKNVCERFDGNNNEFNRNHHQKFKFDTGNLKGNNFTKPQVISSKNSYPKTFTHQERIDECSMYSGNSYSPYIPNYLHQQKNREFMRKEMLHNLQTHDSVRKYRKHSKHFEKYELKPPKQRTKDNKISVNNDFINEIIRRQYKPLELFGVKDSEISQFSAPVCRDQEHSLNENIQEDAYAYDHNKRRLKHPRHLNVYDMRSLCDTRLYSTVKNVNSKRRQPQNTDIYNDSMYYDIVPVKEKQSPKSRRKNAKDALMYYDKYIEVPPSPRTMRPRLNLDAHYTNYENLVEAKLSNERSANKRKRRQVYRDMLESKHCNDVPITKSNYKTERQSCDTNTDDYVQSNCEKNIPPGSSTEPSKSNNLAEENKTGNALNEIKNLLENFLEEIKKESVVFETKSNFAQPNITEQKRDGSDFFSKFSNNSNVAYNNMNNIPHNTMSPSQFIPPFVNPCVYPVMPVCHVGYMPNNCVLPSSSTCHVCANAAKETSLGQFPKPESQNVNCDTNETEVLIKEIYKYVAQKSFRDREDENIQSNKPSPKLYNTRSVGSCNKVTKQNVKIGTHPLRCYSKSCEAIVSHIATNVVTTETSNYSESTKTSQYATPTTDSYNSGTVSEKNKNSKQNRLKNVLHTLGYLKKIKKKDVIEELSESNSTTEVTDPPLKRTPYKQNITTYSMHGQEYFQRPPYPRLQCLHQKKPFGQGYLERPSLNPGYASPPREDSRFAPPYHHYMEQPYGHVPSDPYHPATLPYSTSHDPYYHQIPPPLCLKEIEVRSSATQSERKLGFFRRLAGKSPAKKNPDPDQGRLRTYSTQTPGPNKLEPTKKGPSLWQSWQEKALADRMDAEKFQKKTQRELADRDFRIKNTMVNKLFYKRNPFSPNNLIIRTLLGKDESSYGNRPKINTKVSMFV